MCPQQNIEKCVRLGKLSLTLFVPYSTFKLYSGQRHTLIRLLAYSLIRLFVYSLIGLFIYLFIYLFIHRLRIGKPHSWHACNKTKQENVFKESHEASMVSFG